MPYQAYLTPTSICFRHTNEDCNWYRARIMDASNEFLNVYVKNNGPVKYNDVVVGLG